MHALAAASPCYHAARGLGLAPVKLMSTRVAPVGQPDPGTTAACVHLGRHCMYAYSEAWIKASLMKQQASKPCATHSHPRGHPWQGTECNMRACATSSHQMAMAVTQPEPHLLVVICAYNPAATTSKVYIGQTPRPIGERFVQHVRTMLRKRVYSTSDLIFIGRSMSLHAAMARYIWSC
jgi:hypothetical protein